MLFKNPKSKPVAKDLSRLDQAVSELSKQTEALLGSTDSKPKPALPKRQAQAQAKGNNFDIIHSSQKTKLPASLKASASHPHAKKLPATKSIRISTELLSEHAGKSYNETDKLPAEKLEEASIVRHPSGSLQATNKESEAPDAKPTAPTEGSAQTPSPPARTEAATQVVVNRPPKPTSLADTKAVSHEELAFTHPSGDKETKAKADQAEPVPATKSSDEETSEADSLLTEAPAKNDNQTYLNTITSDTDSPEYKPSDNQQKPTVFDTNEYHPPLHDWSKLERRHHWPWFLVILLLIAAMGLMGYVALGSGELPF